MVRSTDSFKINKGYIAKNSQKSKIAITKSNLKISKTKIAFLGFHSRIPHAKNQLPTTKTVTCRADTDRKTDTHRDKQTEIAKTEGPIDFFGNFFCHIFYRLAVQYPLSLRERKKMYENPK